MFEDLSKYNFILSNSFFTDKENQKTEKEKDKIIRDLNKENGKEKYKLDLNKEIENEKYNTDLNKENYFYSFINKKRKRYFSKQKHNIYKCPSCASSSLSKLYKHIHEKHCKKTNLVNIKPSNSQQKEKNIFLKTIKISSDKKENEKKEVMKEINSCEKIDNKFKNDVLGEKEKKENEKKNIFECKIIKSEIKEKKQKEPKTDSEKIFIRVEKFIAPPI